MAYKKFAFNFTLTDQVFILYNINNYKSIHTLSPINKMRSYYYYSENISTTCTVIRWGVIIITQRIFLLPVL